MSETKFQKVNTKDIVINPLAQRDVEARKGQFNKIMRTFNPDLVNPVKVAFINGKFYCFDGQMTMKVLKARNGGKDLNIDAKSITGFWNPTSQTSSWPRMGRPGPLNSWTRFES